VVPSDITYDGMKRSASLLHKQDVCSLCAFKIRYGASRFVPQSRAIPQSRFYQISQPAGAAVAPKEVEEDDDDYPQLPSQPIFKPPSIRLPPREPAPPPNYELLPDWHCSCGNINLSNKSQCRICEQPRSPNAKLHYPPKLSNRSQPQRTYRRFSFGTAGPAPDRPPQ
jgi:hypothetical protein